MQEKMKSEGKCLFCSKTFAKAGIHRHLGTHLKKKAASGSPGKSFFVMVETSKRRAATPYFLCLWINGETEFETLDRYLRDIWLECCNHNSEFRKKQDDRRKSEKDLIISKLMAEDRIEEAMRYISLNYFDGSGEISIYDEANDIFEKGVVLDYEFGYGFAYNFGEPTFLNITAIEEYPIAADSEIILLSRNEPLAIMCSDCEKIPAKQVCVACLGHRDAFFCDNCANEHAKTCRFFKDDAALPVVNSPRMGKCKYKGGKIDKERDGVFIIK